jgi:hypothetical protein
MLIAILMLIIGFLAGVIATVAYCVHLDAKLIAKHGKENVEPMNRVTSTILNY